MAGIKMARQNQYVEFAERDSEGHIIAEGLVPGMAEVVDVAVDEDDNPIVEVGTAMSVDGALILNDIEDLDAGQTASDSGKAIMVGSDGAFKLAKPTVKPFYVHHVQYGGPDGFFAASYITDSATAYTYAEFAAKLKADGFSISSKCIPATGSWSTSGSQTNIVFRCHANSDGNKITIYTGSGAYVTLGGGYTWYDVVQTLAH